MARFRRLLPLLFTGVLAATPTNSPALRSLSLHDRVAQLVIVRGGGDYPASDDREYRRFTHWIRDAHVGGFIVAGVGAQPFEAAAFINHQQRLARTPLLVGSDFERGASMRFAGTARFPYQMAFGAAHDLNATRQLGAATAREARALGINWAFAPDADVNNNPDNPIINTRSFGEDPAAVAANVAAFIDGAHSDAAYPVLLSAKHFPGHGDTAQDSHMQLARVDATATRLDAVELVPFRAAIAHGVDSIMTAHLSVPAYESNEQLPATLSRNILTNLLRDRLAFRGLVVTDALDMKGVTSLFPSGEIAVRALEAGADVLLMPEDPDVAINAVVAAVRSGRLSAKRIDESARKVLAAKTRLGLFRQRFVDLDRLPDNLDRRRLDDFAQSVADKAFTLVKDDRHLFPVAAAAGSSCLVVMSESQFSTRGQALANALRTARVPLETYLTSPAMPDSLLAAVAADLAHCKQIYVAAFITVGANRGSVALEGGLTGFLKTLTGGPSPVALISFGSPYLWRDFPTVAAYAATFSVTQTSEIATAKALSGKMPITGRLPVSIPPLARIGEGLTVQPAAAAASNPSQ